MKGARDKNCHCFKNEVVNLGVDMKLIGIMIILSFQSAMAGVNAPEGCADLSVQISKMQEAQSSLFSSFLSKNKTVAQSFVGFADEFEGSGKSSRKLSKSEILRLRKTGEAFVAHQEREARIVSEFEKITQDLMVEVTRCLNQIESGPQIKSSSRNSGL